MNPVGWKRLAGVLFVTSVFLLGSILVLPQLKSPQQAVYRGPVVPYGQGDTEISGYYIPTVDRGSRVNVSIDNFVPGDIDISIFPTQAGNIAPIGGGPVYVKSPLINTTATFTANATQPYGIYVISRNGTAFTVIVRAIYSPYFWLPTYSSVAVILVFMTGILLYYYSFTSDRWEREQEELRDARGEKGAR